MILVGYFEGIASQRGIAWRCSDSRSLADLLGVAANESTPDHSSMSRVHDRLPLEVHEEMFVFVLKIAADKKLLKGKSVAVDSTTLEANAAMKSIERKDSGEDWKAYLTRLAQEAGIENPTDEELRRFDKNRQGKKVSNEDWESTTDPDSRITKMKDGTTHLAYKAEHVVDLGSDFVLAATITPTNHSDAETLVDIALGRKERQMRTLPSQQVFWRCRNGNVATRVVSTDGGLVVTLPHCDAHPLAGTRMSCFVFSLGLILTLAGFFTVLIGRAWYLDVELGDDESSKKRANLTLLGGALMTIAGLVILFFFFPIRML